MDAVSSDNGTKIALSDADSNNGQTGSADSGRRTHQFQPGLGDHPLWQALMDEIEKNRQADIAEMNHLADLEMSELEAAK